jgi:hypothetical protein
MSTRDREPESQGPLKYAPKWARTGAPEPARRPERTEGEPRAISARQPERNPPPPPRELPPPWKLTRQRGRFEGDVAIQQLRERMALAPEQPPEPPLRDNGGSVFGMVARLGSLVTVAAIGAYGFVWISTPRADEHGFALVAYHSPSAPEGLGTAGALDGAASPSNGSLRPAVFQPPPVPATSLRADVPRPRDEAPSVDRPQLLAPVPWPAPAADREPASTPRQTLTTGVAARSSAPTPADAAPADAAPLRRPPLPETEIGAAPPAPPESHIDREEIATLLARGRTYLANGDVASARLAFRRAAEGGDAQAALALGGTFDPLVLKSLGAIGVAADAAQARGWYQKAAELGSRDAPQRLDQLAQSVR